MKNIILLIQVIFLCSCSMAQQNELLGVWKSDENMTLNSITSKGNVPEKTIKLFENDFFGHMIHEYRQTESRGYLDNCEDSCKASECTEKLMKFCAESKKFSPYTIIKETPEYFLVESYDRNQKKSTQHYLYREGDCYYIIFSEKFGFKEYFCKQ